MDMATEVCPKTSTHCGDGISVSDCLGPFRVLSILKRLLRTSCFGLFVYGMAVVTNRPNAMGEAASAPGANSPASTNQPPSATTNAFRSKFIDPQDGWLDVSGFLDTAYGFVPLVKPLTDPSLGYGANVGLIFIDRKEPKPGQEFARPNLAVLGGLATENGSKAVYAGHNGKWHGDKIETVLGVAYGSFNLDYYGVGDSFLNDDPVHYNIKPLAGIVGGKYRIGSSPFKAGLNYAIGATKVEFDNGTLPPDMGSIELDTRLAGLVPELVYDTRNNIFTPTRGMFVSANCGVFAEALGSEVNYQTAGLTGLFYHSLLTNLTLGLKVEANFSFGNTPFYMRPYINLRGVAMRRYAGEHVVDTELEVRWQCWKRFSLVGFAGTGIDWNNFEHFDSQQTVVTGGGGFRYELARKYGLHMGLDVACGPDDPILYVQFGSAWFRP
jgi:hypothetical protein